MKRLTKILLPVTLICFLVLPAASTSATDVLNTACSNIPNASNSTVCADHAAQNGSTSNLYITIIKDVIDILSFIVGVAAVIIIIISAIRFVTAGGDTQTVSHARSGLIMAAVGIIVVVIAQSLVVFVLDRLH